MNFSYLQDYGFIRGFFEVKFYINAFLLIHAECKTKIISVRYTSTTLSKALKPEISCRTNIEIILKRLQLIKI